ncbi:MAG: DUF1211 domain-containing protein [Thermoplasmata archaeon]|nr:DUF1211 domain-containing protein [Thermoplasmata archaeon]
MLDDEGTAPASVPGKSAASSAEAENGLPRLLALSDGIFAFAMTLLVLGLLPPTGISSAATTGFLSPGRFVPTLLAYFFGFFVTGFYWLAHRRIFSLIPRDNAILARFNLVTLSCVVLVPFATVVLDNAGGIPLGPIVFALVQAGAGFGLLGEWLYASGRGKLTSPSLSREWKRYTTFRASIAPAVFLLSIPIAFFAPRVAAFWWIVIFLIGLLNIRSIRDRYFPGVDE